MKINGKKVVTPDVTIWPFRHIGNILILYGVNHLAGSI